MIALNDQETSRVAELSHRLRLIQADAASATPKERHEFLGEEIARGLKDLPAADRRRYLEALLARFPVAGQTIKTGAPAPAPAAAPPPPFHN